MIYYVSNTNDTAFNIALEEYCFKNLKDQDEIFLLWINEPSIIVGKYQNTIEEINTEYTREKKTLGNMELMLFVVFRVEGQFITI